VQLRHVLDIQLQDQRAGWDMQADGSYVQRRPNSAADAPSSQETLIAERQQRRSERGHAA
jgi:polyphosphate kinase